MNSIKGITNIRLKIVERDGKQMFQDHFTGEWREAIATPGHWFKVKDLEGNEVDLPITIDQTRPDYHPLRS